MSIIYKSPSSLAFYILSRVGFLVTILGFLVVLGWHLIKLGIIGPYVIITSMEYNSGLCFFIGGLSYTCRIYDYKRPGLFLGLCVLAVGFATLLEYITALDFQIDEYFVSSISRKVVHPGRMAPNTALCFALTGIALTIMNSPWNFKLQQISIRVLGVLTIAFNIVTISTYFIGVEASPGWAEFTQLDPRTSGEFFILSLGIIFFGWTFLKTYNNVLPPSLPFPTTFGVVLSSLFLWQALTGQEQLQFQKMNKGEVEHIKTEFQSFLDDKVQTLQNMAERWNARGGTPKTEWESDSKAYVDKSAGLTAIEWADSTYHIRWIVPIEGNESAKDLDISFDKQQKEKIEENRNNSDSASASPVFKLTQGWDGFTVYVPLFPKGKFDGFIIGVFNFNAMISNVLDESVKKIIQ